MKIAVVTDSTAYLSPEYCHNQNITVLPLISNFGKESYREMIDISAADFYAKLGANVALPTSSQPSMGEMAEVFSELARDYDQILAFTLSKEISGTYQTMRLVGEQTENIDVHIFDSQMSCQAQGFLVEAAVRMIAAGKSMPQILAELEKSSVSREAYFVVDELSHLTRGGRLSASSAMIGSLLRVKPVLHFKQGKIVVFEKVRTLKKTVMRLEALFEEAKKKNPDTLKVSIVTTPGTEVIKDLINYFAEKHPEVTVTVNIIGPVIGTHLGPGAFGITWITDDEKNRQS